MTGLLKSVPVEKLRREAGIHSIATTSKRATAFAYEKAQRLPIDHTRRQILAAPPRQRLKRPSWRSAAQASTSHLTTELAHRAPIGSPFSCPWEDSSNWSVHADNLAVALGKQLFGEPSPPLSVLTTDPGSVLALARKTLL